jgi:hypothetical protein
LRKTPRYATEAALCADFLEWVKAGDRFARGDEIQWTPYAETAGWDILLVAQDGTQIGVEAKLKFNMKVLQQCLPDRFGDWHDRGPDYRAVLVSEWDSDAERICNSLGLALIGHNGGNWREPEFRPGLLQNECGGGWHYWSPKEREKLPEYVPDVPAGASGPVQLTKWKIAALRITATLEVRGFVTREDFRTHAIDSRRWTGPGGWLVPKSERMQDAGQYVRAPCLDFDRQHPDVYAQILAEVRAKLAGAPQPTAPAAPQPQGALL